jgi:hypothetical protein
MPPTREAVSRALPVQSDLNHLAKRRHSPGGKRMEPWLHRASGARHTTMSGSLLHNAGWLDGYGVTPLNLHEKGASGGRGALVAPIPGGEGGAMGHHRGWPMIG